MKTIYGKMQDLYDEVYKKDDEGKLVCRSEAVLLRSRKTDLPLGAFASDGGSSGYFFSRKTILKRSGPYHRYNNSDKAYDILLASVLKAKAKLVKVISEKTGLTFVEERNTLIDAERICTFSSEMTENEYKKMQNDIDSFEIKNVNYTIYAWNDNGGYYYWSKQQNEDNYIQITVDIINPKKINILELKQAVDKTEQHFRRWARY